MARIVFTDQTPGHNPHTRKDKPTGGILNSLTLIPEYLVKQGHEVYVSSTYNKSETVNGVHYTVENEQIPKWDVIVFNRNVLPKDFILYSKEIGAKVLWWLHDIVQIDYLKDDAFKYVDKVIALSGYCRDTYSTFYDIPKEHFAVIPNGVDKSLFYPGTNRNPNLIITAGALTKGYMPIPAVYDNLKRISPDIDFRVYSSQKLHGLNNDKKQQEYLNAMDKAGAHIYQPVSQEVLAALLRQAHCFLMPNSYPEICSNLLLQAQASGCPIITSDIGSAPEFIQHGKTGLMTTKYKPHDMFSWIVEYTNLVMDCFLNKDLHKTISENSPKDVLSWGQVGEAWNEEINKLVSGKLSNVEGISNDASRDSGNILLA